MFYNDKFTASLLLKSHPNGLLGIINILALKYKLRYIGTDFKYLQFGDIVYHETNPRPSVNFCVGKFVIGPGKFGLDIIRISKLKNLKAWRYTK
jgi:hypothetical protein